MKLWLILALIFLAYKSQADEGIVRGTLFKDGEGFKFRSVEEGREVIRDLYMDKRFIYTLDEKMVNSPDYVMEFSGDIQDDKIITDRTPTIRGDVETLRGRLKRTRDINKYFIGDTPAIFGRTKPVYGIPFDNQSKRHYTDKDVITHGHFENIDGRRVFIINAILEDGLISADSNNHYEAPEAFRKDPVKYVVEDMVRNENSQKRIPWRGTIAKQDGYTPKPGEGILIITLSGRQGDDPGAAGGHFAIGGGIVQDDLSIKGETYNFYFEGPKEVLAGNTDLVSYFGHLIQGQQNYRPTYTLYVYGIDPAKLKEVRDEYEKELHKVRTVKGLEITPGYNCTTTSNDVLWDIGIYGRHWNLGRRLFDVQNIGKINPFSWGAKSENGKGGVISKARIVSYVLKTDPEYYVPRAALESFVHNFKSKRWRKRKGIKQVDYIFIPQTPSRRQVGGMSYDSPIKEGNKIISYNGERNKRSEDIKKAQDILLDPSKYNESEKEWAMEYMRKDQEEVKKMLNSID